MRRTNIFRNVGLLVILSGTIIVSGSLVNLSAESVMDYDAYSAADIDSPVTVDCYVQAKQEWWEDNSVLGTDTATIYAQDENGGYFLYDIPCSKETYEKLTEGIKIHVTGYKSEWAGEIEIVADDNLTEIEILDDDTYVADACDITGCLDDEDAMVQYMNQKVAFTGMTIMPAAEDSDAGYLYGWDGSGSEGDDLYFKASKDGSSYTFVVESYLCGPETDVYKLVKELQPGDLVDLEGFLYWYEGPQPHIVSVTVQSEASIISTQVGEETEAVEPIEEVEEITEVPETEAPETEASRPKREHDFKSFDFGMSQDDIEAVEGIPDQTGNMSDTNAHYIAYEDKSLCAKSAVLAYYFTDDDQFFQARYILTEKHSVDSLFIDDYKTIRNALTSTFGEPLWDYENWDTDSHKDYYKGDEGRALNYGYLSYLTWYLMDGLDITMDMSADNFDISTTVNFSSTNIKPGEKDFSDTDF